MPIRFATITARYAGTCARCQGPIAVGDKIRYGAGRAYHLAADCPASQTAQGAPTAPAAQQPTQAARPVQAAAQPAPQPVQATTQPAPTPAAMMSAAIAQQLQGTWTGLLARPLRLGDPADERALEAIERAKRDQADDQGAPAAVQAQPVQAAPAAPVQVTGPASIPARFTAISPAQPAPGDAPTFLQNALAARKPAPVSRRKLAPMTMATPAIDLNF